MGSEQLVLFPTRAVRDTTYRPYLDPMYGTATCRACGREFQARIQYAGRGDEVTKCGGCRLENVIA